MEIRVYGINIRVTPGIRSAVEDALHRFEKYFPEDTEVQVKVKVERLDQICEIVAPYKGATVRVEQASDSLYEAIDKAADKFAGQMRKYKTRVEKLYRAQTPNFSETKEEDEKPLTDAVVKRKCVFLRPMSLEEAILQMNLLEHPFFVFEDAETGDVNVIYARKDGNIGLIETKR